MSYILEALKKSEQQRQQGQVPDLQTVHLARPEDPERRNWPLAVIVLLLVSLAFVIGWMQPWKAPVATVDTPVSTAEPSGSQAASAPIPEPPPVEKRQQPVQQAVSMIEPVPAPAQSQPVAAAEPVAAPTPRTQAELSPGSTPVAVASPPSLDIQAVPHLSEMPRLVQQAIPEMSFAGHVYSSNAAQRSVIINGHSMSEGDSLVEDLVVEQITHKGVVFNYQGQLFRMEILQDWSFDY